MTTGLSFLSVGLLATAAGCASRSPEMSCLVELPGEFRTDPPGWQSPTGEPESVRYTKSYEAFWWNCVMVRAEDLESRCPATCSGTPAATSGCSSGAIDADEKIDQLLDKHSVTAVRDYMRSLARNPEGIAKIKPYFPTGPQRDPAPR